MRLHKLSLYPYQIPLSTGSMRAGILIKISDDKGNSGYGDIAPLHIWSRETLENSIEQLKWKQQEIIEVDWTVCNCSQELEKLALLPSVLFGLESALLTILMPLSSYTISVSALLMGSPKEIIEQAQLRYAERYTSVKLKVINLTFTEAAQIINQLKDKFNLRIDVNRAWSTSDALNFFAKFPLNTFDYIEEPFQNPNDLGLFPHPLAVDESFPHDLSLEQLGALPTLKALIYKPTIQGGMFRCIPLHKWTIKMGVDLVVSSSFESDIGLSHVASIAHRFSLTAPVGLGTYHFLQENLCAMPFKFYNRLLSKLLML